MDISRSPEILDTFTQNAAFWSGKVPSAVVSVQSTEEVLELVKKANESGQPIIPVSSAGRHRKGGVTPAAEGCTMVDLSGCNKIISINRPNRMTVIEPGVTYPQLRKALAEEGLTFSAPVAPRPGKSVMASMLERVPLMGVNRQWNYVDPLSCCNVVWGDGVRMNTGEAYGGSFDPLEQQAGGKYQLYGGGPMMVDYCRLLAGSQGTMGIVTWAALRCNVLPENRKLILATAVDWGCMENFLYNMLHKRCGDQLFAMDRTQFAALMGKPELAQTLPRWIGVVGLESRPMVPTSRIEAHTKLTVQAAREAGVELLEELPGISEQYAFSRIFEGNPDVYWKDVPMGASSDLFFNTTLDRAADFMRTVDRVALAQDFDPEQIGVYVQPRHTGTSCHVEFTIPYAPEDAEAAKKLFEELSSACSRNGAYFQEPYGIWASLQYGRDPQGTDMLRRIKAVFDPRGILNPGKLCF